MTLLNWTMGDVSISALPHDSRVTHSRCKDGRRRTIFFRNFPQEYSVFVITRQHTSVSHCTAIVRSLAQTTTVCVNMAGASRTVADVALPAAKLMQLLMALISPCFLH